MSSAFFEDYFSYVGDTEAPMIYHRWVAVSMVAAFLGRSIYFPFGHSRIYPNMYIMLEGNPGARKGSSLRVAYNILKRMEFDKLAPDRVSAERFLAEMQNLNGIDNIEGMEFETLHATEPSEIYVMADEFQDFIGQNNLNFILLLTKLWDNIPEYKHPKIHGKSVLVNEPTVNIAAAATQQSISDSIPIAAIGQGFFSRLLLVHGDPTGKKITFPRDPDKAFEVRIQNRLIKAKEVLHGPIECTNETRTLLDRVYKEFADIDDFRFKHYNTRRFTHILKLCLIFTAMDCSKQVLPVHVLQANTLLHFTEQRMPKALGEFGKAKNADVANNIIEYLKIRRAPAGIREIWKQVAQDLNKIDELLELLRNLEAADKIVKKEVGGKTGYLPYFKVESSWSPDLLLKEFLTPEELL